MTRINAGIQVEKLIDSHLVAEYREILRVGPLFTKRISSNKGFKDIPAEFTFATGHVKFFYNKGEYIKTRWHQLYDELVVRQFKPTLEFHDHWINYPEHNLNYIPTDKDIVLVQNRIISNILNQKGPIRYKGETITFSYYLTEILK